MFSTGEWNRSVQAALDWIAQSIRVTGARGSSHSFSVLTGWAAAYPETTGYLLETLYDYADIFPERNLRGLAESQADWLLTTQLPNGAFPAGKTDAPQKPSVFNATQILIGLSRHCIEQPEADVQRYRAAMQRTVDWLTSIQESDGAWRSAAYVNGFVPAYYTRAVWGVLAANSLLRDENLDAAMHKALDYYSRLFLPNGAVRHWGFYPGKPAFTHTIAYTLEGFWESARLLDRPELSAKVIYAANRLLVVWQKKGRLAGRYDENWRGDYSFRCATGHAQLSVFYDKLFCATDRIKYKEASEGMLAEIMKSQHLKAPSGLRGALPGSAPVWGKYLRFRYPNWATKFFLDAMFRRRPGPC